MLIAMCLAVNINVRSSMNVFKEKGNIIMEPYIRIMDM